MTQPRKNSILALAIVLGIFSLPMAWISFTSVDLGSMFPKSSFGVSALSSASLFSIPLWMFVFAAGSASSTQLMHASKFFDVPAYIRWLLAVAAAIGMSVAVISPVVSIAEASPGPGAFLGLLSSAIPISTLIMADSNDHVEG